MRKFLAMAMAAALVTYEPISAARLEAQMPTGEEQRNARVILDATEAMNRHDVNAYVAFFADDAANFGRSVGREGIRSRIEDIFKTFPDYRHDIVELVAKGDAVIIRNKASGTHMGVGKFALNGGMLVGIPPTKKRFEIQHIHWFKLRGGKIMSHTANRDDLGMMLQLGLLPKPVTGK